MLWKQNSFIFCCYTEYLILFLLFLSFSLTFSTFICEELIFSFWEQSITRKFRLKHELLMPILDGLWTHLNVNIQMNAIIFKIVIPGECVFISLVLNFLTSNTYFSVLCYIFHNFLSFSPTRWFFLRRKPAWTFCSVEITLVNTCWASVQGTTLGTHFCLAALWGGHLCLPMFS